MNGTFYGVLGVGPDADEEAIRAAYRERVKEHHPDVSADPDAADRFRRLTVAKETLLDAAERARYDRLGHRAYVEAHADPSLWTTESSSDGPSTDRSSDRPRDVSDRAADGSARNESTGTGTGRTTGTWAGRTARNRRSSSDRAKESASRRSDPSGAGRSRSSAATPSDTDGRAGGPTTGTAREGSSDPGPADSGSGDASPGWTGSSHEEASNSGGASNGATGVSGGGAPNGGDGAPGDDETTGSAATADGATASPTADGTASSSGSTNRASETGDAAGGARRRTRRPSGSYATTSFWGAAENRSGAGRPSDTATRRALIALRRLGPWILVHALFLSLAVGTGWYVYAVVLPPAERSAALLFVLIGEVGLAVVLSSLHILSRLYR
ncbi:DnaJ domain-containing protein [Halosimplex halobium]|uniref:J domain-containing protein n=1 Tax=Halosimplex halobium TaxID=3396618 RepID=UPI003F55149F